MEFHFELRPLEVALAYPSAGVSWFTMSDGWFWITLGDAEVFRVDYQIDRFWERWERHATRLEREFAGSPLPEIAGLDLVRVGAAELLSENQVPPGG